MILVRVIDTGIRVTAICLRSRKEEAVLTDWSEMSDPHCAEILEKVTLAADKLQASLGSPPPS